MLYLFVNESVDKNLITRAVFFILNVDLWNFIIFNVFNYTKIDDMLVKLTWLNLFPIEIRFIGVGCILCQSIKFRCFLLCIFGKLRTPQFNELPQINH